MKLLSLLLLTAACAGQSCAIWSGIQTYGSGLNVAYRNYAHHKPGGYHTMVGGHYGTCYYQNQPGGNTGSTCITTAVVSDNPSGTEVGPTTDIPGWVHVGRYATKGGSASGIGSVTASAAEAAIAVESCFLGQCNFTVSISLGGEVKTSSGSPIWTNLDTYSGGGCPSELLGCPLIFDTANEGFQLTSAADGVETEMVIPGHRIRFAWTKKGSRNAFLYINGHIMGNALPPYTNGFDALKVYDTNSDGRFGPGDAEWDNARLWIDSNHNGAVDDGELFTLPALGYKSILLEYRASKYVDEFNNHYVDAGHAQTAAGMDRKIVDVVFSTN